MFALTICAWIPEGRIFKTPVLRSFMRGRGAGCLRAVSIGMLLVAVRQGGADTPGRSFRIVGEHYPPFEFVQDGVATGINVEVTARIFQRMDIPLEITVNYPFPRAWAMLKSGNTDAELSVSSQPYRQAYVYCTPEQKAYNQTGIMPRDYLWITEYVYFVHRRNANLEVRSYNQLREQQYRVGVCKDYSYDGKLLDAGLNTVQFINPDDALRALSDGEIDLFPMDYTIGSWLVRDMGMAERVTSLDKGIFHKPYLMMFSRASSYPDIEGIWRRFYEELRAMRDSGEYASIYNRYLPPAYPFPLPRPIVFVAEEWVPFEFIRDGIPAGINVDVVDTIMKRLALPYEIRLYPWSRAWMMAEKGKADAVLSISYKSTREDVLYFTPEQRSFAETRIMPPDYLWMSEYVFFIMKNQRERLRFESYEQIKREGYRVGLNKDYSYSPEFVAAKLGSREYPDTETGMRALVNGEIDLYPMDKTVGNAILRELGFDEIVTHITKPMFSKPYLVPFVRASDMPANEAIMKAFNAELRLMRETGEYDEIAKRARLERDLKD